MCCHKKKKELSGLLFFLGGALHQVRCPGLPHSSSLHRSFWDTSCSEEDPTGCILSAARISLAPTLLPLATLGAPSRGSPSVLDPASNTPVSPTWTTSPLPEPLSQALDKVEGEDLEVEEDASMISRAPPLGPVASSRSSILHSPACF